jgi:tetratricopeptide (TPR) repeat protein
VGDTERALRHTRRVLRADPENAHALAVEARLYQAAGRHEESMARAIDSLALVYFQPLLHCLLGRSLSQLREWQRAEESFRVALAQAPGLPEAHLGLGRLLRRHRARVGEASLHLARAEAARRRPKQTPRLDEAPPATQPGLPETRPDAALPPADRSLVITVVSGLPRSGTSMMMQMLAAGGVEPYTDGRRPADSDNPRGYFEHGKATGLHNDSSWLPEARGKAVKIVA